MQHQPKVSVVIPVYNSQAYLRQCLGTVVAQSLADIEVVCVDDGSTDGSRDILEEYAAQDSRIVILRQGNAGAGPARNRGAAHATGEYLAFWDSDDYFDASALELMYRQAKKDDADVCVCSAWFHYDEPGIDDPSPSPLRTKHLKACGVPFSIESNPDHILNFTSSVCWNKLFSRQLVTDNGLAFASTKTSEDAPFTTAALCLAQKIAVVNKRLVYYRAQRPGSIMGSISANGTEVLASWLMARKDLQARGVLPERSFANRVLGSMLFVLQSTDTWESFCGFVAKLQPQLDALGIVVPRSEGYYFGAWHLEMARALHEESPEQILMRLQRHAHSAQQTSSAKLRVAKRKLKRLGS